MEEEDKHTKIEYMTNKTEGKKVIKEDNSEAYPYIRLDPMVRENER